MNILRPIRKALDSIELAFFTISAIGLVGLTVAAVFTRYVMNAPIAWCEEIQMILVVWLAFSGASIAFREHGHIAIDLLTNSFPKSVQKVIEGIVWILVMIALCWITKLEFDRTLKILSTKQASTILQIPKFWNYGVIVIMCVNMVLNHFFNGVEGFKEWREMKRGK